MKYKIILFLALLLPACFVYGQNVDPPSSEQGQPLLKPSGASYAETATRQEFSSGNEHEQDQLVVRRFDKEVWKEVIGTTDYTQEKPVTKKQHPSDSNYSESAKSGKRVQPPDNDEDLDTEQSAMSPLTRLLLTIVAYAGAIGMIGYILFLIIKNLSSKPTSKVINQNSPDHTARIEDIKELEIDKLLREALEAGNFRLAVRIYFLGMLKTLDQDGIIIWKKDKTNRDYLAELFLKAYYFEEIKSLTFSYEEVWYGEHDLPVESYQQIISSFKSIGQQLKGSKPA